MKKSVIAVESEIMGGTPVFRGTRVPMQTLIDYLEAGDSITDFLEGFPSVSKEQVIAFLEEAKERAVASA
jgi:uncharacterized protein (DUF433 family)